MIGKGVLLVDDEAKALKYFTKAFSQRFSVFSAHSAREALEVLSAHSDEIGVVVTDQRMPESSGVELLKIVRREYPRTVRILTTAYSELDLLIEAINSGAVFSFVTKPWQLEDLEQTLIAALEHYDSEIREHQKLERKLEEFREQVRDGRTYDVAVIAAKIGHYVHNALCPVTLILDQMLEERDGGAAVSNEFVASVNRHVHEVARTLKDLGQLSEPPLPDDFEPVDIAGSLRRAIESTEMLRREKALEMETTIAEGLAPVIGVPEQIEKLFRFMIAEEVVSLPTRSRVRVEVSAAAAAHGGGVNVVFEDFEPLRPEACEESLLHPFTPRGANPREFGVFLASSYLIAHHHGGDLQVTVKPNRSLLFSFYFPRTRPRLPSVRLSGERSKLQ